MISEQLRTIGVDTPWIGVVMQDHVVVANSQIAWSITLCLARRIVILLSSLQLTGMFYTVLVKALLKFEAWGFSISYDTAPLRSSYVTSQEVMSPDLGSYELGYRFIQSVTDWTYCAVSRDIDYRAIGRNTSRCEKSLWIGAEHGLP